MPSAARARQHEPPGNATCRDQWLEPCRHRLLTCPRRGPQSPVGAETQHKRLVAPSLQRNGSQQRGVKIWRDEQRRAQREVPNTVGPVDGLILKRLIPETDDFQYQVGVYPHRWG